MPTFKHTNLKIDHVSKRAFNEIDCFGTVVLIGQPFDSKLKDERIYRFLVQECADFIQISLWELVASLPLPNYWTDGTKYTHNGNSEEPNPTLLTFLRNLRDEIREEATCQLSSTPT